MDETLLCNALEAFYAKQIAELGEIPEHKFSLKHRIAMKFILAKIERKIRRMSVHKMPLVRRVVLLTIMIFIAAIASGCALVAAIYHYFSQNFTGKVFEDNTQLFVVNLEGAPETIEEVYYLSELPEGFELLSDGIGLSSSYKEYFNTETQQRISFFQYIKSKGEYRYNTEDKDFEYMTINGLEGVCVDFDSRKQGHSTIIWDCGDYILVITADLPKNEMIKLAGSAKK